MTTKNLIKSWLDTIIPRYKGLFKIIGLKKSHNFCKFQLGFSGSKKFDKVVGGWAIVPRLLTEYF